MASKISSNFKILLFLQISSSGFWMVKGGVMYAQYIHTHTLQYYSVIKRGNPVICDNTNECGRHFAKWNKPGTER